MRFAIDAITVNFHDRTDYDVRDIVERELLWSTPFDDGSKTFHWERFQFPGNEWSARSVLGDGDVTIMTNKRGFLSLQLKSRACEMTQENIPGFNAYVKFNAGKHTCSRIDGVWCPVPWSPEEFLQHLQSPELVSRIKTDGEKCGSGWVSSDGGDTASFPSYDKRKGAPRFLRLYDQRGYNRLELQLNKKDADCCWNQMGESDVDSWPKGWLGYLLRHVDFRTGPQKIVTQRPRSQWWADFVGEAAKMTKLVPSTPLPPERTLGSRVKGSLRRNIKTIHAAIEVLGISGFAELVSQLTANGRGASPEMIAKLKREWFPPKEADQPSKPFSSETFLPFDVPF